MQLRIGTDTRTSVASSRGTPFELGATPLISSSCPQRFLSVWLMLLPLVLAADPTAVSTQPNIPSPAAATRSLQTSAPAGANAASVTQGKFQTVSLRPTKAASSNFVVYSVAGAPTADEIASLCEARCTELRAKWLGLQTKAGWSKRCDVVLHRSRESYLAAVGKGGAGTLGSSLVQFDRGGIASRRIDLLAHDRSTTLSALPHELTHVVLADRFGQRALPRWADEGVATLEDPAEKQRLHLVDLQRAVQAGRTPRLSEVLFAADYPPASQRALYYGSSLSLVRFLSTHDQPERVLDFVEKAMASGHQAALKEVYGIRSVEELEHQWLAHVQQQLSGETSGQPLPTATEQVPDAGLFAKQLGR